MTPLLVLTGIYREPGLLEKVWNYIRPNDFWPYLIIAGIGVLFTLLISDRKSFGEIIKDVLIKCGFLLVLYGIVLLVVYFLK